MKSATSTIHEQLARQAGIIMSEPKEPYFFSDDPVYAKGIDWYTSLFAHATADDLCGESTTHYTKLPTYPHTIDRIEQHIPNAKFIYVMRHPIDRLVSQYIHQWTEREIEVPLNEAIGKHPELIAYSRYAMQLQPYFETFGRERVLPVFFDSWVAHPQAELSRICQFIGYTLQPEWQLVVKQENKSAERMRVNPLRDAIVNAPILSTIRRRLIPQSARDAIKQRWQMRQRPTLTDANRVYLQQIFDKELAIIGKWLGINLNCNNFKEATRFIPSLN